MPTTIDYFPQVDGVPTDPTTLGGGVDTLRLFTDPEHVNAPIVVTGPAAKVVDQTTGVPVSPIRFRFVLPDLASGTYWSEVTWRRSATSDPFVDQDQTVVFPRPPGAIADAEDAARRAGVDTLLTTLTPAQRQLALDAIYGAQADVEAFLNRPIVPVANTETVWPGRLDPATNLPDPSTLTLSPPNEEQVVAVTAYTANSDGTWRVTYTYGLDGAAIAPIKRYVVTAAAEELRSNPAWGGPQQVTSISVPGQSVSFTPPAKRGEPGGPPSLDTLKRWKRRSVWTRTSPFLTGFGKYPLAFWEARFGDYYVMVDYSTLMPQGLT